MPAQNSERGALVSTLFSGTWGDGMRCQSPLTNKRPGVAFSAPAIVWCAELTRPAHGHTVQITIGQHG